MLFDILKIQRNTIEDDEAVIRAQQEASGNLAPGLALAYFRYIENVVRGVYDKEGNMKSKPHEQALKDWRRKEIGSERDWISNKILILFPESDQIRGTVQDIAEREKDKGENHCLALDTITHSYQASGNCLVFAIGQQTF